MRYTYEIDRKAEPDGAELKSTTGDNQGLGPGSKYLYVSVFDGNMGKTYLSSLTNSPPAAINQTLGNVDAQNLDTRAIMMALRPLDPVMGHLLVDRALPNERRRFFNGRSTMILEERYDPSGWKTSLWIEPERNFLVNRYHVFFQARTMVEMDIDYVEDARWGWIPSGWRISQMLDDGSIRLVSEAKVTSYSINQPIGLEEFR